MQSRADALYRSIWRWHFYAGLVVAPFMLILAVTGAIYLFNDEINDALYPELRFVDPVERPVPLSRMIESALAAVPGGRATRLDTPRAPDRSVEVFVSAADGAPVRVNVDPGSGRVLGLYTYEDTLVGIADRLHGSLMLGVYGDAFVELVACWGFILTVTGLYLWWPRGRRRFVDMLLPLWNARRRHFWKSVHGAIGLWTAALIMFLIITGLPWAEVWGDLLRRGAALVSAGYPQAFRGYTSLTSETIEQATNGAGPWTLNKEPGPQSSLHIGQHGAPAPLAPPAPHGIGIDRVGEILTREGMLPPYRLNFPKSATGVYAVFVYPDRPQGQRSIYIDQYSGRVIGDVGYADYGPVAKAVELGVQLHMGNYFGFSNQIVLLVPCIGIIVLALTGPYMWWRRRPKGAFGAPPALGDPRPRTVALIAAGLAIVFPLAGASLLVVLIADLTMRWIAGLRPLTGCNGRRL